MKKQIVKETNKSIALLLNLLSKQQKVGKVEILKVNGMLLTQKTLLISRVFKP